TLSHEAVLETGEESVEAQCLPSEIWNEILIHLSDQDRLNLRACSRGMEHAISLTDMHVDWSYGRITCHKGEYMFRVSKWIRLKAKSDEEGLGKILEMRRRLCTRMHGESMTVSSINYNRIPASYIESLLEPSLFTTLTVIIRAEEFHPDVIKLLKRPARRSVRLLFKGFAPDRENLLAICPTGVMKFIEERNTSSINEHVFLELVGNNHRELIAPLVKIESPQTIFEAVKVVMTNCESQSVSIIVDSSMINKFMSLIGFRREDRTIHYRFFSNEIEIFTKSNGNEIEKAKKRFLDKSHVLRSISILKRKKYVWEANSNCATIESKSTCRLRTAIAGHQSTSSI
ncbi:hypothetical protein PMAYCL1PPCAC_05112, partial [Pristionchus mayeri]